MRFRMPFLLVALTLALTAGPLAAQSVHFSGKVEDGESICYYCPGFGFVLDNTHTKLASPSIDLLPFIGSYVRGVGEWDGSATSPTIVVSAIAVVAQSFSIGGSSTIGNKMNFSVFATPGETALIALALQDGFFLAGSQDAAFLSPLSLLILGSGIVKNDGEFNIKVDLPNLPELVGLGVFGQAALLHTDGSVTLTNSDLRVIG